MTLNSYRLYTKGNKKKDYRRRTLWVVNTAVLNFVCLFHVGRGRTKKEVMVRIMLSQGITPFGDHHRRGQQARTRRLLNGAIQ